MFTANVREAVRTFPFFKRVFKYIFEKTRLPLVPIYGFFPVKLRTYIGEPIEYSESMTADVLRNLVNI
jgi:hypothetical protein